MNSSVDARNDQCGYICLIRAGVAWVWSSFASRIAYLCMLFVVHGYIPSLERLKTRRPDECLFRMRDTTFEAAIGEAGGRDGAYLVKDCEKGQLRRAGTATNGLREQWGQHERSSMLTTEAHRRSVFYGSYPHKDSTYNHPRAKGTFQDLEQLGLLGFDRQKAQQIVDLFEWSDLEKEQLGKLSVTASHDDNWLSRQYRHSIYCAEIAGGLALDPLLNLSSNPGFEWQLRFYGA